MPGVKHLHPNTIFFERDDFTLIKVIGGDKRIFDPFDTTKTEKNAFDTL